MNLDGHLHRFFSCYIIYIYIIYIICLLEDETLTKTEPDSCFKVFLE